MNERPGTSWRADDDPLAPARGCVGALLIMLVGLALAALFLALLSEVGR